MRTKGEQKGGGTEKTEKRKGSHCRFSPCTCGCLFIQAPTCRLPERPVREGAPCPLPTGVIKPRNQPPVHRLWACSPEVGFSPTNKPAYREICQFTEFPQDFSWWQENRSENMGMIRRPTPPNKRFELISFSQISYEAEPAAPTPPGFEVGLSHHLVIHQSEPLTARESFLS